MSAQTVRIFWHVTQNRLGSHTDTHTHMLIKEISVDVDRKGRTNLHKEAKKNKTCV